MKSTIKPIVSNSVDIIIFNRQSSLDVDLDSLRRIVAEVISFEGQRTDEVAVNLVTTAEICDLHDDHFDDPSPTDCISFPIDGTNEADYHVLGEIFVCPETAILYSQENGLEVSDELRLYVIHGLLHLMGYDDIEDLDRREMREAEARHVKHLNDHDLNLKLQGFRTDEP